MQRDIHNPGVRMLLLHIAQQQATPFSAVFFFVKWVKSGHVTELFFPLRGNTASHVGVFDFPSMTAPLQGQISADAPNRS